MSIWYEIENEWEVEYNGDDDTFEILFRTDTCNEYVSVPAKYILDLIEKYDRGSGSLMGKQKK